MAVSPIGGSGANSATGTTTSQSISPPAGAAAGDLALLVGNVGAGLAITMGAPGGWTQLLAPTALASGTGQIGIWYKTLSGNGSTTGDWAANAIFITASAARAVSVGLGVSRGGATPVVTSINGATGTTSLTSGAATPAVADSLLWAVNTGSGNTTGVTITQTPPGGYTEQVDTCNTRASVSRQFVGMHTKLLSGQAGVSQGSATATASGNTDYQAVHVVVAPADASVSPPAATATGAAAAPVVTGGAAVAPPAATATASAAAPAVSGGGGGGATVSPPAATATAAAAAPTVSGGATVSPPATTATGSAAAPVAKGGATVHPPAATATAAARAPAVFVGLPGPGGLPTILVELDDTSGTFPYDITSFVDLSAGYSIQHGRGDQFEDIEASVLTMTLDNKSGAAWAPGVLPYLPVVDQPIRVTHTVAGSPSKRFTGYVQRWPAQWSEGMARTSTVTITAVDRLPSWARKPLRTVVEEEHLRRVASSGSDAYFPLSEPAGATTSSSIVPQNNNVLNVAGRGAAILFAAGTAPTYGPTAAALFSAGQYLTVTESAYSGAVGGGTLSCFINTSAIPPGSSTLMRVDGDGGSGNPRSSQRLYVTSGGLLGASVDDGLGTVVSVVPGAVVNDGITHHVAMRNDGATLRVYVDGVQTNSVVCTAITYAGTLYVGNDPDGNGYVGTLSHVATSSITVANILNLATSGLTGFAGERSDQRVARLLDRAAVPSGSMSLETGAQTMPAADTWEGTTVADALGEVVTAEHGLVFVAGDGTAVMQNRYHRASETTPDATLDAHDINGDVQVLYDMDQGANYVTGTRTNGVPQLAQDPNSINGHGTYPVDLGSLLVTTDGQVLDACWWRVNSYSEPVVRLPGATVDLLTQPTTFQQTAMGLEISDRFAVTNMPYPDFADQTIEGWTETVQASLSGAEWSLQFNTTPWTVDQMWILGDTTYGVLDSTTRLGL